MTSPVALLDTDLAVSAHVTVLFGEANGKYPDGNSVVVQGSESALLIDPSLSVHHRGGVPAVVDCVVLSHAHEDHMAGIGAVPCRRLLSHHADLTGVQSLDGLMDVYGLLGADPQDWRRTLVESFHIEDRPHAQGFDDGATFDLGGVTVRVMHLPGHTRGHSAFVVEPDGVAFVGDIDLSGFGPYYGDHWSDLEQFVASIGRVRDLEADTYVTFHHKGVVHGHATFVAQLDTFASAIDRRDDQLIARLAVPRSFADLVDEGLIYRPGTRPAMFGESVERRSIALHLERLMRAGQVVLVDSVYIAR